MYGFPRGYRTHMFYNNTIQHNTAQPKYREIYETIQLFFKEGDVITFYTFLTCGPLKKKIITGKIYAQNIPVKHTTLLKIQ